MKLWGGRRGSKLASDRGKAAPALPPGARRPTRDEQREMQRLLDRMLDDEQTLRLNGHNSGHASLYARDVVATMEATVQGKPIVPDEMYRCLDLLDQLHRMAEVADQGVHKFHEQRQVLQSMHRGEAA